MNIQLRPYQQKFIDDIRDQFKQGFRRVVGVAPCGAGKTIMTGWMIRQALERGRRSIFFVHRKELIAQTAKTFYDLDIPFGVINANSPMRLDQPVQIASVQTLAKRIDKIPAPDFLICDECHHILANTYKKVLDAFPKAFLLGVTATPLRLGGITLADVFNSMVESLSVNELIHLGNLTPFKYFAPEADLDLSKIKTVHGDFDNHELERVMSDRAVVGNIIDNYFDLAAGKSAICYCVNVNHSQAVADAFRQAGIRAAHCDGETNPRVRDQIVADFRAGNIEVLCNAELFGEGFDVPACQAVILARPTQSLTLFIQQAMRPLRPDPDDPDKVAVIIDHVKNYQRHGLPNTQHDWELTPNLKKKVPCPHCGKKVVPVIDKMTKLKRCPKCGEFFPKKNAPMITTCAVKQTDGNLIELRVDYDAGKNNSSVKKRPDTIEELLGIAENKGYQKGWAAYRALEFANSFDDCKHIGEVCGYKSGWAYYKWREILEDRADQQKASGSVVA